MNKPFIGIAGNIGVGKTTFTTKISNILNLHPYYESVIDNPYLNDFYKNMDRWSFNLQIYFLNHRFRAHQEMLRTQKGIIQDNTQDQTMMLNSGGLANLFRVKNYN